VTSAVIEGVRAAAERHVGDDRVPGLVALVAHGDDVHVEAHGSLAVGGGPPVTRDSIFRIASLTKPITAAVTLAIAAEGLLDLDAPVDALAPELAARRVLTRIDAPLDETVPARRPITARDLLTFTFGFGFALELFTGPAKPPVVAEESRLRLCTLGRPDPAVAPAADSWIAGLGTLPLLAQPGERWLYGTGASVLGVLVERAAGEPFADVLRTRILEPLGMRDTAFWTGHGDRLATAYRATAEGLVAWDAPGGAWSRPPAFCDGAGGLVSTVDDLHAFARMLLDGGAGVLAPADARALVSDQLTAAQKAGGGIGPAFFDGRSWGLCVAVNDDGSFGWDGGFGASWSSDPGANATVIVLTQRMYESFERPAVHREIHAAAG
jgi:CubicO group peptidase (beta-lactamase class C family)